MDVRSLTYMTPTCTTAVAADPSSVMDALNKFIGTIESTGGLIDEGEGLAPAGDPEWLDLADAYLAACKATGRVPMKS